MKIITAPEIYNKQPDEVAVFLAGGITNCDNWQNKVINYLKEFGVKCHDDMPNLVIYNPRRENFDINDPSAAHNQVKWEHYYLERADIFSMYFAASEKSDQPICMYELGRYITRMQMRFPTDWIDRIIVSSEKGYKRIKDVRLQLAFATNSKVYLRTELEETTDLIEEHADEILYEYSMINKDNKLTW